MRYISMLKIKFQKTFFKFVRNVNNNRNSATPENIDTFFSRICPSYTFKRFYSVVCKAEKKKYSYYDLTIYFEVYTWNNFNVICCEQKKIKSFSIFC